MTHREETRGFYSLAALGLFALFLQFAFYMSLQEGGELRLYDTDAYMRLVRVEELHQTGNWFDNVIHRSNAPYGESSHWTRPLDVLLLIGALVLQFFADFHHALLGWGIMISPLLQIAGMGAVVWGIAPFIKREYQWHAAALFLWTPSTLAPCYCGRPDHHSLLVVLFVLEIGCMLRLASALFSEQKKQQTVARLSWLLGGLLAFSMWVSVESLAVIAMCAIVFGSLWLLPVYPHQRARVSSFISRITVALFIGSCIAFAVEKPFSRWSLPEYDCLSIVHLSIFGFLALCGLAMVVLDARFQKASSNRVRPVFAVVSFIGLLVGIGAFFSDFFRGPYAHMDPLVKKVWLAKVMEIQPLIVTWPQDLPKALIWFGPSLVGALFVLERLYQASRNPFSFLLRKLNDCLNIPQEPALIASTTSPSDKTSAVWLVCGAGLLIFMPLTIFQARWTYYAGAVALFPLAILLNTVVDALKARLPSAWAKMVRLFLVILFIGGFLFLAALAVFTNSRAEETAPKPKFPSQEEGNDTHSLAPLCRFLSTKFPQTQRIATFIDFGPEILYRTPHEVIATPYHRNSAGILAVYHLFNAERDEDALRIIRERKITLLLIQKKSVYAHFCRGGDQTLFNRLLAFHPPPWLHPVELPTDLASIFLLFEVLPENASPK